MKAYTEHELRRRWEDQKWIERLTASQESAILEKDSKEEARFWSREEDDISPTEWEA